MWCCAAGDSKSDREKAKAIDDSLRRERQDRKLHAKLLLLGTGESGKSTFLKQMKILFLNGFKEQELDNYREMIQNLSLTVAQQLIRAATQLKIKVSSKIKTDCLRILEASSLSIELVEPMKRVWQDSGIQETWSRRNEYQIEPSADYFLQNLDRVYRDDYTPSVDDILHARQKTTGISEVSFNYEGVDFVIVDVGGQRSERRKWLNCFEDVLAIIYFVALNECTGESGKSTFLKQMKILFLNGFKEQELDNYREMIQNLSLTVAQQLIRAATQLKIKVSSKIKTDCLRILEASSLSIELVEPMKRVWQDSGIQETWSRRNEYQIEPSADYFLQNLDRVYRDDYAPSVDDILHARQKTTGISEVSFNYEGVDFVIVDVGGQRSERRKWLNCFEDVLAIIYFVALNEYDMKLVEDERVNRMQESLELFQEIGTSKLFQNTLLIVFYNKLDVFKAKLPNAPLSTHFSEFQGPGDWESSLEFIKTKFTSLYRGTNMVDYVTCTIDTSNIDTVFHSLTEVIKQRAERAVI